MSRPGRGGFVMRKVARVDVGGFASSSGANKAAAAPSQVPAQHKLISRDVLFSCEELAAAPVAAPVAAPAATPAPVPALKPAGQLPLSSNTATLAAPWTVKYAPTHARDAVLEPAHIRPLFTEWLDVRAGIVHNSSLHPTAPLCVLLGPSGCGKRTFVNAAAADRGLHVVELDVTTLAEVVNSLASDCMSQSLRAPATASTTSSSAKANTLYLVTSCDGLEAHLPSEVMRAKKEARRLDNPSVELVTFLRSKHAAVRLPPTVFIGRDWSMVLRELRVATDCRLVLQAREVDMLTANRVLTAIVAAEGAVSPAARAQSTVLAEFTGDLYAAIAQLELAARMVDQAGCSASSCGRVDLTFCNAFDAVRGMLWHSPELDVDACGAVLQEHEPLAMSVLHETTMAQLAQVGDWSQEPKCSAPLYARKSDQQRAAAAAKVQQVLVDDMCALAEHWSDTDMATKWQPSSSASWGLRAARMGSLAVQSRTALRGLLQAVPPFALQMSRSGRGAAVHAAPYFHKTTYVNRGVCDTVSKLRALRGTCAVLARAGSCLAVMDMLTMGLREHALKAYTSAAAMPLKPCMRAFASQAEKGAFAAKWENEFHCELDCNLACTDVFYVNYGVPLEAVTSLDVLDNKDVVPEWYQLVAQSRAVVNDRKRVRGHADGEDDTG